MNAAQFPIAHANGPATVHPKATGAFVSVVVTNQPELQTALMRTGVQDSRLDSTLRLRLEQERHLVYGEGRWEVFDW